MSKTPLIFTFRMLTLDLMPDGDSLVPHQTSPTEVTLDSCRNQGCAGLWNYVFWLIWGDKKIFQRAFFFYFYLYRIARIHRADAGWRAGGNDVAWQQRHDTRNIIDKLRYAEDEVVG